MKKVLLIVDAPEVWEFMSFYLAMQGCKVYRSGQVDDILETCRRLTPNLVVMDSSASRMVDIKALYPRLAADPFLDGIKFLILCNRADYEKIMPLQRAQDSFITRPIRPKMLLITVRDLVYNEKPEWIRLLRATRVGFP